MSWEMVYSQNAVAWTEALLRFLWQGTLIGAAAWAALRGASRPRTRYGIACAALVLMAAAPLLTVALVDRSGSPGATQLRGVAAAIAGETIDLPLPSTPFDWRRFVLPAWLAGVALLAIRAAGGWTLALRRVRHGRVRAAREIDDAVQALERRFGLRRAVRVFESAAAGVPLVFGWIRPVLLVPVGAVTGLGPDELRAVLAHEVAHIARHDFAVNCLQSAVEVLLFYHPAVWWISRRIREEREMCCDEAAVEICGDAHGYSCALLALEESRQRFAMAASGGSLKARIERLLLPDEQSNSLGLAAAGVLAAVICGVAMSTVPVLALPPVPPPAAPAFAPAPPAPPQNESPRPQPQMTPYSTVKKGSRPGIPAAARRPVVFIMSREQQDEYVQLKDDAARDRFVERFWAARTPKEKAEHERRVRYAEERFGWDTARGRTYIKEGPPDVIEAHPGELWEAWTYHAAGQKYTFAGENYGTVSIDYGGGRMVGVISRAATVNDEAQVTVVSVRDKQGKEIAGVTPPGNPYYPALARQARVQGQVVLRGAAGANGKVLALAVVSGHPLLAQAAMETARKCIFGAEAKFEITIRFTLKPAR